MSNFAHTEPAQTFTVNVNPEALKQGALALESELAQVEALACDSAEMALVFGQLLIEQLRVLDEMQAQRDMCTKPLHQGWKNTCALFAPGLLLQEKICRALKDHLSAWHLDQAQKKELATREARAALAAGDVATIDRALAVVNSNPTQAQGVSVSLVWKVKRVAIDLLPLEYHTWDAALVQAEAEKQGTRGEQPPVIPGVIFEREAPVTGRRSAGKMIG